MWRFYNPNPKAIRVGDCTVRAISKLTNKSWEDTYCELALYGLMHCDMPSANAVWGAYLRDQEYERRALDNSCPDCYCVEDFAADHPRGKYLLAISGHVVAQESFHNIIGSIKEVIKYAVLSAAVSTTIPTTTISAICAGATATKSRFQLGKW